MCQSLSNSGQPGQEEALKRVRNPRPEDVPLGTGIAARGKNTILTRRERLRLQIERAGG